MPHIVLCVCQKIAFYHTLTEELPLVMSIIRTGYHLFISIAGFCFSLNFYLITNSSQLQRAHGARKISNNIGGIGRILPHFLFGKLARSAEHICRHDRRFERRNAARASPR